MNPEIKTEWVKRLRSGDYKQGKEYLKTLGFEQAEYCCLGILCEMAVEQGIATEIVATGANVATFADSGGLESVTYLPHRVKSWAGLFGSEELQLARMNDEGVSFSQIATLIESTL